jgi:oligosaccharide repeat unit polymerase
MNNLKKKTIKFSDFSLRIIIVFQVCIFSSLIFFRLLYEDFDSHSELLIYPFCCLLIVLVIYFFWSWIFLTKSLFNPYTLFLLSAFLFNGGQAILEIFHLNEDGILTYLKISSVLPSLSDKNIVDTLFLVIICLTAFHFGALISLSLIEEKDELNDNMKEIIISSRNSYLIGKRLFLISLLPTIITLKSTISVVLSSGYHSLYEQDSATSFSALPKILADFLVPASLFLLAGSRERPKGKFISLTIIVMYAMIIFFSGERNKAIMPLLSLAWLWHQLIHPIPKAFLLSTGALIVFFIFPVIATTRNTAGQDRLSISLLLEAFSSIDNPVVSSISEMGSSMITVAYTLQLVPSERDFQMGTDYFYALLTLIPNIFGKLHPTIIHGLPNKWLTEQVDPVFASLDGSYGFSFIAEAYLNFGWVGAPIALGVIGFLFTKLILWALKSCDPAKMAMIASFLSFFLFYARAESAMIIRPLVWYSLIPYLCVRLLNRYPSEKLAK